MKLTNEQQAILNSSGNIKINAVAGSGKTTTVIEYAKTRPKDSKILYLAFNKSVKLEAAQKFKKEGLRNVRVETAHSLAFSHIVKGSKFKINSNGYKIHEVVDILGMDTAWGEGLTEYILANHVNRFAAYFCNSNADQVKNLNYLNIVPEGKAQIFVQNFYPDLVKQTRIFLAKMNSGEIEITHDFYLKKFQLSQPKLNYDYILFDEGQDASPAMLDVFINQKATKVIVGDTHQQIYGWRFAINSLNAVDYTPFNLSTSFRFGSDIASLARATLNLKKYTTKIPSLEINGKGNSRAKKSFAILARTNLALLLKAIEHVVVKKIKGEIYFEGNIHSYTYATDGASLYDVLNLFNEKRHLIRDKLIKKMKSMDDLEKYIEQTEEMELSMMVEIVKNHGNQIPSILNQLKDRHVTDKNKDKAEIIFSTVHRCKGMEYDIVELANDFITEEKLKKMEESDKIYDAEKLSEEINLLYVGITRTKNLLTIPEEMLPLNFPSSKKITVIPQPDRIKK